MLLPRMPWRWATHALGLRLAYTSTTPAEQRALMRHAAGKKRLVEIGTDEGANSLNLRSAMHPDGVLYLIDPYRPGRLGVNFSYLIAKREVSKSRNGRVVFVRQSSHQAALAWHEAVELVFVDGDHSRDGALRDWLDWSPCVSAEGLVAFHDANTFPGGWVQPSWGPVQVVAEIIEGRHPAGGRFEVAEIVDSLVVLRRVS